MSPTVFRKDGYRFFFFSREEGRRHVHVISGDGEAKFWLDQNVELAKNHGLSVQELNRVKYLIEENLDEIKKSWDRHFSD